VEAGRSNNEERKTKNEGAAVENRRPFFYCLNHERNLDVHAIFRPSRQRITQFMDVSRDEINVPRSGPHNLPVCEPPQPKAQSRDPVVGT
jgi:hypothetical protein